jgi:hypothetical protein
MIVDQRHIDYYKKITDSLYLPMVLNDYGSDKQDLLLQLTDSVSKIYKHLKYNSFKSVVIYTSIEGSTSLSEIAGANPTTILSYDNLSPLTGEHIVIEVKPNGDLHYSIDFSFDINVNRNSAIIYNFVKSTETETIFGKASDKKLPSIPDSDSYFAIQTYKDLDLALEDYNTKVARHSECGYLKDIWADANKIFFKPKPEHILRDSLTHFLKIRLRNTEVRPEQIVDKSHPVDIKVTWTLASHLALIEIKWLGKSLRTTGTKKIKQIYTRQRALNGAKQLADYLDANLIQSPVKTTRGYLAIFDARRWGCNKNSTTISNADGMKYLNDVIIYNPNYNATRTDFAKPFKFFMQPSNMTP